MKRLASIPLWLHLLGGLGVLAIVVGIVLAATQPSIDAFVSYAGSYTPLDFAGFDNLAGVYTVRLQVAAISIAAGAVLCALWVGRLLGTEREASAPLS